MSRCAGERDRGDEEDCGAAGRRYECWWWAQAAQAGGGEATCGAAAAEDGARGMAPHFGSSALGLGQALGGHVSQSERPELT